MPLTGSWLVLGTHLELSVGKRDGPTGWEQMDGREVDRQKDGWRGRKGDG